MGSETDKVKEINLSDDSEIDSPTGDATVGEACLAAGTIQSLCLLIFVSKLQSFSRFT